MNMREMVEWYRSGAMAAGMLGAVAVFVVIVIVAALSFLIYTEVEAATFTPSRLSTARNESHLGAEQFESKAAACIPDLFLIVSRPSEQQVVRLPYIISSCQALSPGYLCSGRHIVAVIDEFGLMFMNDRIPSLGGHWQNFAITTANRRGCEVPNNERIFTASVEVLAGILAGMATDGITDEEVKNALQAANRVAESLTSDPLPAAKPIPCCSGWPIAHAD